MAARRAGRVILTEVVKPAPMRTLVSTEASTRIDRLHPDGIAAEDSRFQILHNHEVFYYSVILITDVCRWEENKARA